MEKGFSELEERKIFAALCITIFYLES